MAKSTTDLCSIMRVGGGVSILGSGKSTADLCSIARSGSGTGATLIVRNAGTKSTADLCSIARSNPGNVIFEFVD